MHTTTALAPPDTPPFALESPAVLGGRDLALALLGLLGLGAAAAVGLPPGSAALRLTPSVVLVDLGAMALTAPALIAVHQYLRLAAAPERLAAAIGRALIHGGRVAAGLSVVVLFFSATTNLAIPALLVSLAAVGLFTSTTIHAQLHAAERAAAHVVAPRFSLLVWAYLALSWMIALRVGVDVSTWVLAARDAIPHDTSLGLFAAGVVAETCSTPGTTAFRLRASDKNPGARSRDGLHHGLLGMGGI